MKQVKNVVLTAMVCLSALCWRTASAATECTVEMDGSTWKYELSISKDKTTTNATITAVTPADGALVVPSAVDGYKVVAIGDKVGQGCENITSLVVADTVRSIGYGAFALCTSLGEVVLGDGVKGRAEVVG